MNFTAKCAAAFALLALPLGFLIPASTVHASTTSHISSASSYSSARMSTGELTEFIRTNLLQQGISPDLLSHESTPAEPGSYGGPQGAAAKLAVKAMMKKLRNIGQKAWDETVSKIPLPDFVKQYITYQSLMKVLNIVTGFEGYLEDMIAQGLESIGCNSWFASAAARAITTLLL